MRAEITGEDAGKSTLAWQRRFPHAGLDVQAGKLVDRLALLGKMDRDRLLAQIQGSVGALEHPRLAWAAYRFTGPVREQVWTALVNRVGRLERADLARRAQARPA